MTILRLFPAKFNSMDPQRRADFTAGVLQAQLAAALQSDEDSLPNYCKRVMAWKDDPAAGGDTPNISTRTERPQLIGEILLEIFSDGN